MGNNMKLRVLYALIALILALLALKVFWWDKHSARAEIENAFLTKKYSLFLEEVSHSNSLFSDAQKRLYMAYGLRAAGNLKKSDAELEQALQDKGSSRDLILEIVLNQTLNAYLQDDQVAFTHFLDQIDVSSEKAREWKKLFQGVEALKVMDCKRALKFFQSPMKLEAFNPIMRQSFAEKIPPAWTFLQIAQCEMLMGEYEDARAKISEIIDSKTEQEAELARLLLAKSYLLEANDKEISESVPYYHQAIEELGKVSPRAYSLEYHQTKFQLISSMQRRLQNSLLAYNSKDVLFFENALSLYHNHEEEKIQPVVEVAKVPVVDEIDEWSFETPLDLNYLLIQKRIDSILDGEKQLTTTKHQMEEDARFLSMLTQIKPPLTPVFFLLGQVELLLHEDQKAAEAFRTYVEMEPDNIWGWKLLALAQLGVDQRDAAEQSFLEVVKINPVDLAAWKSLGRIYYKDGKRDQAIRAFERARTMDPFDDEVISSLNELYGNR
jgi:tetratricopeptide (TPR) repeat protein